MEKQRIFVSTSNFKSKYENNLNKILESGIEDYNFLEIASGHRTDNFSLQLIKEKIKEGKKILFHNYSFSEKDNLMINLCEENVIKRNKIIEYIKQMILLTKEIGEDYYSIHGGFYPKKLDQQSKKAYNNIFFESLAEIVEFAQENKVYLGVENHVVEKQNIDRLFLFNEQQYEELFHEIESPYLKLHLDVGHLKVSSKTYNFNPIEFIKKFSDKLMTVHLHDNNGLVDMHGKFDENAYFISALKDINGIKNIVIETWDQDKTYLNKMIRSVENVL